jgi:3-oxoadipate enol-lactonase
MSDTEGAAVVLCGSLGSTSLMWAPQRPALAGRRVVEIEHPGHGAAPITGVEDVGELAARVLEGMGDERFSFVGISLGGAIGMRIALDAPERLKQLVLAFTSPLFGEPQQWLDRAATVREHGLESIVEATLGRWFTPAFGGVEPYRAMILSVDPEGYARCCEALARFDVRAELAGIHAPTLVVSGEHDPTAPPEIGESMASLVPGARFELIAGAAHLANVERPADFNRLLEGFL